MSTDLKGNCGGSVLIGPLPSGRLYDRYGQILSSGINAHNVGDGVYPEEREQHA